MSFKALIYLEASELTIIGSSRTIITIISAVLILGEEFNEYKAVGAALIIFSVIYISKKSNNFKFNKGVLYALGYALCFGLAVTNDTY